MKKDILNPRLANSFRRLVKLLRLKKDLEMLKQLRSEYPGAGKPPDREATA